MGELYESIEKAVLYGLVALTIGFIAYLVYLEVRKRKHRRRHRRHRSRRAHAAEIENQSESSIRKRDP